MLIKFFRKIKGLDKTRIEADENAVTNVMDLVTSMINPLIGASKGVHLSSRKVSNDDIKREKSNMFQRGEASEPDFMETNILSSSPDIHSPIKGEVKSKTKI